MPGEAQGAGPRPLELLADGPLDAELLVADLVEGEDVADLELDAELCEDLRRGHAPAHREAVPLAAEARPQVLEALELEARA